MTPIHPATVTTPAQLRIRDICTALSTAAMLFSWAVAGHHYAVANEAVNGDMDRIYRLLKAGCKFPSLPGEAGTWAIGADGSLRCWEQRDRAQ